MRADQFFYLIPHWFLSSYLVDYALDNLLVFEFFPSVQVNFRSVIAPSRAKPINHI